MEPDGIDWCEQACAAARAEGVTLQALQAAHEVSETPEQFWVAVQAAIELKKLVNA